MSLKLYYESCYKISRFITKEYSTSFSLATSFLEKDKKEAIYAIYGFVRLADEIVDSFHGFDKPFLLNKLKEDLYYALENGISINPVLTSFAHTVYKYNIQTEHIQAFLNSMEKDLTKSEYTTENDFKNYVFGSADVVGLMCLKVFCNGQHDLYMKLKQPAQKLGSAFQKVNFLRDLKNDIYLLGRTYFPELSGKTFDVQTKKIIEKSIQQDFDASWEGIKQLPGRSKLAVALAYFYYKSLFNKIKKSSPEQVLSNRMRISHFKKYIIILIVILLYKIKFI
ncbi:MAG: phytoene/squalene synthase family protein [Bacteroidales bacterium]